MTDHVYEMSALNQNVGYNMPTQLGYYLGSDLKSDSEAWPVADGIATVIDKSSPSFCTDGEWYTTSGLRVAVPHRSAKSKKGIYIRNGRKYCF